MSNQNSIDPNYLDFKTTSTLVQEFFIKEFTDESQYNEVADSLFMECLSIMVPVVSLNKYELDGTQIPFNREQAALVGNFVRYWKISRALLDEYREGREEIIFIHVRCLVETYINIKYFMRMNDEHTVNHYIKHSLRQEKKIIDELKKRISEEKKTEPIEQRMLDSIRKSIEISGFTEDEIKNSSKWQSKVKARINELIDPLLYVFLYGNASHAIHGNWQDIISYHVDAFRDGFEPYIHFNYPNCKVLNSITMMSCELLQEYSKQVLPDTINRFELLKELDSIMTRTAKLRFRHEEFYQERFTQATSI